MITRPVLVMVTGPPGAGKTTLALKLSRILGWPTVGKDPLKSAMLRAGMHDDVAWSYDLMFEVGRDLLMRHDDGLWAVPGGLVEVGETLTEAALRELQKETELDGAITRLLGIFDSRLWKSRTKSQMYHVVFEAAAPEGTPVITNEARDWAFFAAEELPHLSPGHADRVPFLFKLANGGTKAPYFDFLGGQSSTIAV